MGRRRADVLRGLGPASPRDWREAAGLGAAFGALAVPLALASGAFGPLDPTLAPERVARALLALAVPSLAEELAFRWPVARRRTRGAALVSVPAFALWHLLGGWLLPPARPVLWDPAFLLMATALGAACAASARRSGTIRPAVALHWAAVAGWTLLWGGPDFGP